LVVEHGKQASSLFRGQPIADPHAMLFHPFYPPDSGRQIGTQKPAVRSLIRKPADSR
jgi:hypothetical protein